MKLKNFMFATMIACAFASCSEDDAIIDNGPDQATGSFTINVATPDVITKAAAFQSKDELKINDFTVHVYRVGGTADNKTYTWVAKASQANFISSTEALLQDGTKASQLTVEGLPLGETYVCYGYANLGEKAPSADNTDFGATAVVKIPDAGFVATSLPMVGVSDAKVFTTTDREYTVTLNRTVSRVDIVGLNLDADAGTNFKADKASFKLTDISINGVTTKVNHGDANAITAIADASTWGWMPINTAPWNNAVAANGFFHNSYVGEVVENAKSATDATAIVWNKNVSASVDAPAASYYILPNPATANKVNIALQGEFGYTQGTNVVAPVASTYAITLADQGTLEAKGVLENNKLYRVDITVAGPGSLGKAALLVNATVADYELKTQTVVVE